MVWRNFINPHTIPGYFWGAMGVRIIILFWEKSKNCPCPRIGWKGPVHLHLFAYLISLSQLLSLHISLWLSIAEAESKSKSKRMWPMGDIKNQIDNSHGQMFLQYDISLGRARLNKGFSLLCASLREQS